MSELTAAPPVSNRARPAVGGTLVTMAWRNLWRVRRRTWLTASGVGFAVFFIVLHRSVAAGAFDMMIELATEQLSGHAQVQHAEYLEDPRIRYTVGGLAAVTETLTRHPAVVAVAPRGMGFALVSADAEAGETSFGAQVMGIDPAVEFATLGKEVLPGGRPLERTGEGLLGSVLARNLGAEVGGRHRRARDREGGRRCRDGGDARRAFRFRQPRTRPQPDDGPLRRLLGGVRSP